MKKLYVMIGAMLALFATLSPVQVNAAGPCHIGELFVCPIYCLVVEGSRAELGGQCAGTKEKEVAT